MDKTHSSLGFVDNNALSVKEMVRMTLNKTTTDFGIEGYNIPYSSHPYKTQSIAARKGYVKGFMEKAEDAKKWIPGSKYETCTDWKKILPGQGRFSSKPKSTYTNDTIKLNKKLGYPGPASYDGANNSLLGDGKTKASSGNTEPKANKEILEAEWHGH